jgi:integrase
MRFAYYALRTPYFHSQRLNFAFPCSSKSIAKRERVLSDHEIAEIWTATSTAGAPYGSIIRLLILTGQRRGEVAGWLGVSARDRRGLS